MTRILRKREVLRATGLSHSSLYREMDAGRFPPGTKLGRRAVGWFEDEVNAYVEQLRRQRDNPGPRRAGRPRKGIWPRLSVPETTNPENPIA
jgi:prophage regulatory protein